jgi:hypothetical protein
VAQVKKKVISLVLKTQRATKPLAGSARVAKLIFQASLTAEA